MLTPRLVSQTSTPTNRKVLGHFVESGFGRQVAGMWSEMIFNRAFREVMPYSFYTWEWLGFEEPMYTPEAPFWHSGYEEHDWRDVGNVERSYTHGFNTFKGTKCLAVENLDGSLGGLAQDGLYVHSNTTYNFTFFGGVQGKRRMAGLNGFEGYDHIGENKPMLLRFVYEDGEVALEETLMLSVVQGPHELTLTFPHEGVVELQLLCEWTGRMLMSWVSMMPADNIQGWRSDVVELMREVQVPLVRFPGGCFVSFYNWEASIGPRDRREPQDSYYWGGLEENDVGLDEFMDLAELVGFEPQVCFNMMSSQPFKARQMVEYLNAPATEGMGRLRAINGHETPRKAKLFEMDNEPWRKWSPLAYAEACVEFGEEMRKADPSIELMMACYGYSIDNLEAMLDIAGNTVNYVIFREGEPEFVWPVLEILRRYNEKSGNNIKLVNTEWLPWCGSRTPFEEEGVPNDFDWGAERITNDYKHSFGFFQIRWSYALNGAERILDYMTYGGEFESANFNNCCNTWGQNIINASKTGAWLSCAGEMFRLFGDYFLEGFTSEYDCGVDGLKMVRVELDDGQRIFAVNNTKDAHKIALEGTWAGEELVGPNRLARITEENNPLTRSRIECSGPLELKPWSVVALKA